MASQVEYEEDDMDLVDWTPVMSGKEKGKANMKENEVRISSDTCTSQ